MMKLLQRQHDLVCRQVVELVSDYVEGALSRSDRKRFETHLRNCPNCTNYLEQIRTTIKATGTLQPDDLSADALREFTGLYRQWIADGPAGPTH
jgi:anti-sigma factor RsiW